MSKMIVVPALEITPARLVKSSLSDMDYGAWNSATAYKIGDRVTVERINYEVLADHTNRNPVTDTATPAVWMIVGWVNKYRMFNKQIGNTWGIGTFTSNPESIDLTIRPGRRVNAMGLVGVAATSVRVVVTMPGTADPIYDQTFAMSKKKGVGWYQFFFGKFAKRDNVAILDLPPASNADVRVIINAPGSTAQVGMLILGWSEVIGTAVYDTSLGRKNYTTVKEEFDGSIKMTKHGKRRLVNYQIVMEGDEISSALHALDDLSDTAALYVGAVELDYTIIAGTYEDLSVGLPTYGMGTQNLSVRSLN
ncbi:MULTISPECIES: carbohydrate-binding protein [unclassified Pseudomonas]|uniref:carbohydrate-binding protein n=1 Tax=unclassified Pseudomonas TaxID=196821 RepID=UPI0025FCDF82|nr:MULTISPECIES: carbohydrate-binding protein [unclassified Pseudomonas]